MNNMKYSIIKSKGSHDYDIQVIKSESSTSYQMTRSHSELWTKPGEHILTITDDGNDMHFNPKIKKAVDYSTFCEIAILIEFIKNSDKTLSEEYETYKIIK